MRYLVLAGLLMVSTLALAQQSEPADASDESLPTEQVPEDTSQRGFYSNGGQLSREAERARTMTKRSTQGVDLRVVPAAQIAEQCLIHCIRMGYAQAECSKGCSR